MGEINGLHGDTPSESLIRDLVKGIVREVQCQQLQESLKGLLGDVCHAVVGERQLKHYWKTTKGASG